MSAGGKGNRTRKTLSFFRVNFGHTPPYEVLCDGPTIFQSLKNDLYLKQSLPKLLGGPAYPVVTECVVKELRTLGDDYSNAALFAKRVKRVSCVHERKTSVAECLTSALRNPSEVKFVLATTDPDVISKVTRLPGIPIVSIMNQKKFILKAPSLATLRFVKESEKKKTQSLSEPDRALVDRVKAAEAQSLQKRLLRRKRKRAKGPNPLSVKKSKPNHEKSDGNLQQLSSLLSRSAKSPGDNSLLLDKHNDKADNLVSNGTRSQAVQIKLHESRINVIDAGKEEVKQTRIRREGNESFEIPDQRTDNAIKDMDEPENSSNPRSCITSKSSRKRRRKSQKGKNDTTVAAKTFVDLSRSTNPTSAGLREEGSLTLKDSPSSVIGGSQRRVGKDMPMPNAERIDRMSLDNDIEMHIDGNADASRSQPLVGHKSTPNAEEPESRESRESRESSEGNVTENLQVKGSISGESQNDNKSELQSPIEGCKDVVCDTDNAQMTAMDETQVIGERDIEATSTRMDGKKTKKKQRKNRRRRPKKNGSV